MTATRPAARIAIVSPGTSEFDSRAHRIARSCVQLGDTVTMYARQKLGMPTTEWVDGYRIVRTPLMPGDLEQPSAVHYPDGLRRYTTLAARRSQRAYKRIRDRVIEIPVMHRMEMFPGRPLEWATSLAAIVEPHDIWHGMWAASLPALDRIKQRHGGRTVYDSRDIYLRSREFDDMPGVQRWLLTTIERRWARRSDAVVTVNDAYARIIARDLGVSLPAVVMNCPERWVPPTPRPDRIRALLGLPSTTAIVLYQGLMMTFRGIEQSMDAILDVPDAVLVLMGAGRNKRYAVRASSAAYAGKVHFINAVPPQELLAWTASSDVMLMAIQPTTENHTHTTPQKLWEAMAAGVPVVASDLPGMASVVRETGCGVVCDPTDPRAIAAAIRGLLKDPAALREAGDRGLAAAHASYNWERQFGVLDAVYERLLSVRR